MKICLGLALACVGLAGLRASALPTVEQGPRRSDLPSRSAFLAESNLADVEIAPSGSHVAFLKRSGERRSLWLLDTGSGERRMLVQHSEATHLSWSSDGQWLFLLSARSVAAVPLRRGAGGGVMSLLGGKSARSLLDVDRSQGAAFLVREAVTRPGERWPSSFRVLRLTPSRSPQLLFTSRGKIDQYITAPTSFARVIGSDHFSVRRIAPDGRVKEVLRCVRLEQCSLLSSSTSRRTAPDRRRRQRSRAAASSRRARRDAQAPPRSARTVRPCQRRPRPQLG